MKYNITLNQEKMIEYSLSVTKWCILDILSVAPTWCEIVSHNEENYFWVARQKISEELEAFDLKDDTIFRYLKSLKEDGFIDYEKQGKKDLIRLTSLGKSLFTMSEKNPNYYVGKKSENYSEKNPTYNYTNTITIQDKGYRLTSLPDDMKNDLKSYMQQLILQEGIHPIEIDKFVNYWRDNKTKNATKTDWKKTFKIWCSKEYVQKIKTMEKNVCL